MNDYYTESQMQRIEQAAYDGAMLEAGKEWERQRYEFGATEAELAARIAELEAFIDQLIEAGNGMKSFLTPYVDGFRDSYPATSAWESLVKDWKEG